MAQHQYLDNNGLVTLWNKIKSFAFANFYTKPQLENIVSHDESSFVPGDYTPEAVAMAVSVSPQSFSEEQKAQARANIGVDELVGDIESVLDVILGGSTVETQKKAEIIRITSGDTLNASLEKYYLIMIEVGTYSIVLPEITDYNHINGVIFFFATGANPSVTFTTNDGSGVFANDGFSIEANTTYEINAIFNGFSWFLASIKINGNELNPSQSGGSEQTKK